MNQPLSYSEYGGDLQRVQRVQQTGVDLISRCFSSKVLPSPHGGILWERVRERELPHIRRVEPALSAYRATTVNPECCTLMTTGTAAERGPNHHIYSTSTVRL